MGNIERWMLRPDGTYDGPMAEYESVVRESAYVGASAGQAAFKAEAEQLKGAVSNFAAILRLTYHEDMPDHLADAIRPLCAHLANPPRGQ